MSNDCSKVPSFVPGIVLTEIGPGICQDGAKYLFAPSAPIGHLRVKPLNDRADQDLAKALRTREEVVIGGYFCRGVEPGCERFDCFVVRPAASFAEQAANM